MTAAVNAFTAGRAFLEREGRLVERRLAAALFDGGPVDAVVDTLRGYRNPDGGFGHAASGVTSSPTAAGRSRGSRRRWPPRWSGGAS